MSAECAVCGHDLPFEAGCEYCALRAQVARLEARNEAMAAALEWYGEQAQALVGFQKKPDHYLLAIYTTLSADGGKRARAALSPDAGAGGKHDDRHECILCGKMLDHQKDNKTTIYGEGELLGWRCWPPCKTQLRKGWVSPEVREQAAHVIEELFSLADHIPAEVRQRVEATLDALKESHD